MRILIFLAFVGVSFAIVSKTRVHPARDSLRQRLIKNGPSEWNSFLQRKLELREVAKKNILAGHHQIVNDFDDLEYVANFTVGTGGTPQVFQVLLDTGSANFWIPDKTCEGTMMANTVLRSHRHTIGPNNLVANCNDKHKFDSSLSPSYQTGKDGTWVMYYFQGMAEGFFGTDTLMWGDTNTADALVVGGTMIGQATYIDSGFDNSYFDGILGLAFPSLADSGAIPPFISAINQGLVDQPLYTVYLQKEFNQDNVQGGVFTWGAVDTDNCGPLLGYAPLTTATYFQFHVDTFTIGGKTTKTNADAISQTSSAMIYTPPEAYDVIGQGLGGTFDRAINAYRISCDVPDDANKYLTFAITGFSISIKPANIILPYDEQSCVLAILPYNSFGFGAQWIFGDPVVRQYCTVHDFIRKRIGFAPAL